VCNQSCLIQSTGASDDSIATPALEVPQLLFPGPPFHPVEPPGTVQPHILQNPFKDIKMSFESQRNLDSNLWYGYTFCWHGQERLKWLKRLKRLKWLK